MKAMILEEFGEPDVFRMADLSSPEPARGEIMIRVAASSVNPIDWKIRSGLAPALAPDFPAVLHGDVAGTVEAVGPGVERFKPGDEVYACAGGVKGHGGALAEFMVAQADLVALKPATLTLTEAAVLPVVALTAWGVDCPRGDSTGTACADSWGGGGSGAHRHSTGQVCRGDCLCHGFKQRQGGIGPQGRRRRDDQLLGTGRAGVCE